MELRSLVPRDISMSKQFAKEALFCDTCSENVFDASLRLPAEALESRMFDENDSQKEWKDSSSDE